MSIEVVRDRLGPAAGSNSRSRELPITRVWWATAVIGFLLTAYHLDYEGALATTVFAGAITTALIFALTFASRRILFSITLVALFILSIVIASEVKQHYIGMVLHAYDIVFYLTSWSTLVYLSVNHLPKLIAIVSMLTVAAVLGRVLGRGGGARGPRRASAV